MPFTNNSAGVYVEEINNSYRIVGTSTSIAAIVGESDKGPLEEPTLVTSTQDFIDKFGTPNPKKSFLHYSALAFLEQGSRLYVTRVNDNPECAGMVVRCADATAGAWTAWTLSTEPFSSGAVVLPPSPVIDPFNDYSMDADDILMFCAINPGEWGNSITVEVKDITNRDTSEFTVQVYQGSSTYPVERFSGTIHEGIDGFGQQSSIEEVINRKSTLIRVRVNKNHPLYLNPPVDRIIINAILPPQTFDWGLNGEFVDANSRKSAIIGGIDSNDKKTGWEIYSDPEEIAVNILINSGYTDPSIQRRLNQIASNRMDAFAILDVPSLEQGNTSSSSLSEVEYRRDPVAGLGIDSTYAALYAPDILVTDQYNNINLYVPPSGYVAATFAKTDQVAAAWYAPAGINRATLNVNGVRVNYNQPQRDIFAEHQVNPIRSIKGYGIVIWGADTLAQLPSALSNIGVRRLMSYMERSIADALIVYVFEPNTSSLRSQLTAQIKSFMDPIKAARGVYWYDVICNESNNPPSVVSNGDLIIDVFVDPTLHVKRIHLNAVIARTGGIQYAVNYMSMQGQSSV